MPVLYGETCVHAPGMLNHSTYQGSQSGYFWGGRQQRHLHIRCKITWWGQETCSLECQACHELNQCLEQFQYTANQSRGGGRWDVKLITRWGGVGVGCISQVEDWSSLARDVLENWIEPSWAECRQQCNQGCLQCHNEWGEFQWFIKDKEEIGR